MATPISYSLRVAGQPADPQLIDAIRTVEVEDHAKLADVARLRVATAIADRGASWSVLDEPICDRLANVKIAVRLGGESETPLIDGYVIDVKAELSANPAGSTIEIVVMDATALMDLEEKVKAWPDQSDSAIASSIFGDYSFDADVTSTQLVRQANDVTVMQRETDIRFLNRLAERNGFECYVEVGDRGQTVGHFGPPTLQESPQAVLSVNMGTETNVDGFALRYDMLSATQASASGIDVQDASAQPARTQSASLHDQGDSSTVATDRPRVRLLTPRGLSRTDELQTLTQAAVDRSAFAITAEGTVNAAVLGQALRAKKPVLVRGAGSRFSGQFYVERVLHRFDANGYQQRVTLKRNAAGVLRQDRFTEDDSVAPQPAVSV
ncbi:MAG TPA: contractile injection system protein, VgrG/Pvc8 family [Gaiellaceae bacterium]|nr:contractile injection system protein, VgrG/Pvc8 family [Gaiellaceae bacterium]